VYYAMRAKVVHKPAYSPTLNISLTPCPERNFSIPQNQLRKRRIISVLCWRLFPI
jgi:hypothetical protein